MELDRSWLGGFIDGEGYFGLCIKKNPTLRLHFELILVIQISSSNREILELIEKSLRLGRVIRSKKAHGNYKSVYYWYIRYLKAEIFAREIEPFLILKKDVCHHFLKIAEKIRTRDRGSVEEFLEIVKMRDVLNDRPRTSRYRNLAWFKDYFQKHLLPVSFVGRDSLGRFVNHHPDFRFEECEEELRPLITKDGVKSW